MKLIFSLLFTFLLNFSFGQLVINDAHAELREVASFTDINVSDGITIILSQGSKDAVAVSASDVSLRQNIKTEVKDGVLYISYDNPGGRHRFNEKLRAYISFRTLHSLTGSGACDFTVSGTLHAEDFRLELSSASSLKSDIDITNLSAKLSGASTAKISGKVNNIKIATSGASDFKSYKLVAENCIGNLHGASDVRITVSKSLDVKASGASTFYYLGNPLKTNVSSSGASKISRK